MPGCVGRDPNAPTRLPISPLQFRRAHATARRASAPAESQGCYGLINLLWFAAPGLFGHSVIRILGAVSAALGLNPHTAGLVIWQIAAPAVRTAAGLGVAAPWPFIQRLARSRIDEHGENKDCCQRSLMHGASSISLCCDVAELVSRALFLFHFDGLAVIAGKSRILGAPRSRRRSDFGPACLVVR